MNHDKNATMYYCSILDMCWDDSHIYDVMGWGYIGMWFHLLFDSMIPISYKYFDAITYDGILWCQACACIFYGVQEHAILYSSKCGD